MKNTETHNFNFVADVPDLGLAPCWLADLGLAPSWFPDFRLAPGWLPAFWTDFLAQPPQTGQIRPWYIFKEN